jgi:hypothetical protein
MPAIIVNGSLKNARRLKGPLRSAQSTITIKQVVIANCRDKHVHLIKPLLESVNLILGLPRPIASNRPVLGMDASIQADIALGMKATAVAPLEWRMP